MTREEAKEGLIDPNSGNEAYNQGIKKANRRAKHNINKIFDYFKGSNTKARKSDTSPFMVLDEIAEFNMEKHQPSKTISEYLKSQTCINCKYFSESSGRQPDGMGWREVVCEYHDGNFSIVEVVDEDFGCNKWEHKDGKTPTNKNNI